MSLYDSILITGGHGMLGHALTRALAARGHAAVAVDRAGCDVTNASDLEALFQKHHPTLLLNCAAHTKVDLCEEQSELANAINGHAVGRLAALCGVYGTTLVHYSTDFVFPGDASRPYRPDDPTGPLSAYGRSKLLGEQLLQQHAPARWLLLRTAWLYGRDGPCFPRTMVNAARAGKPLKVVNDQIGCPTWTDDLADATLDLLDADAIGIWHVTNAGQTSWFDFTRAILDEFGIEADLSPTTSAEWSRLRPTAAVRPAYSVLDVALLEEKLGRPMRSWREALRAYRAQVQ